MSTKTLNMKQSGHLGFDNKAKSRNAFMTVTNTLLTWQERASMRYRLADMDQENLSDVGLTRRDTHSESKKAFWQN